MRGCLYDGITVSTYIQRLHFPLSLSRSLSLLSPSLSSISLSLALSRPPSGEETLHKLPLSDLALPCLISPHRRISSSPERAARRPDLGVRGCGERPGRSQRLASRPEGRDSCPGRAAAVHPPLPPRRVARCFRVSMIYEHHPSVRPSTQLTPSR